MAPSALALDGPLSSAAEAVSEVSSGGGSGSISKWGPLVKSKKVAEPKLAEHKTAVAVYLEVMARGGSVDTKLARGDRHRASLIHVYFSGFATPAELALLGPQEVGAARPDEGARRVLAAKARPCRGSVRRRLRRRGPGGSDGPEGKGHPEAQHD